MNANGDNKRPYEPKVRMMGLWKKTKEDGSFYMTGRIGGGAKVLLLPNRNAGQQGEPDYELILVDDHGGKTPRAATQAAA